MRDVTESSVFSLGVAQVIRLNSYGIATAVAVGTAQLNATSPVSSISLATGIGSPLIVSNMNPTGIDAASGVVGSPSLAMVMSPDGIVGGESLGTPETVATAFIIPGPFDPTNDFGDPVITRNGFVFRPPRNSYPYRVPPRTEYEGISLLKESGVWSEVTHPDLGRTLDADLYLGGGRDHVVSTSLKAELEDLGYTVIGAIVTTEDVIA